MYYYFERKGKPYIFFYRLKKRKYGIEIHEKITRRLYHCKPSATHSGQYIKVDGRKFWIDDSALLHKVLN